MKVETAANRNEHRMAQAAVVEYAQLLRNVRKAIIGACEKSGRELCEVLTAQ